MENINFEGYKEEKRRKDKIKKEAYKTILSGVNQEISEALALYNFVTVPIPSIMLEVEDYNPLEALEYVVKKLCKNKQFAEIVEEIKIVQPYSLYIKFDVKKMT